MMNPEVKAKWVAALRSGEYKQTQYRLKTNNGYCCLGVLCEVSKIENGFGIDENTQDVGIMCSTVGDTILQWAGLNRSMGDFVYIDNVKLSLSRHNDAGRTFAQIADAIEAQL